MSQEKFDLGGFVNKKRRDFSSGLGDMMGLLKDSYDSHIQDLANIILTSDQRYSKLKLENEQLRGLLKENNITIPELPDAIKA